MEDGSDPDKPWPFKFTAVTWPLLLHVTYVPQFDVLPEHTVVKGDPFTQNHGGVKVDAPRAADSSHIRMSCGDVVGDLVGTAGN